MRKIIVFYAWQSDRPNNVNRGFIEKALVEAAKRLNANIALRLDIKIDQDTQGLGGTPPVSQEILKKIGACDVFVGDLTFVAKVDQGEKAGSPCPNPNVLVEYGHALSVKGWPSLMPVMNVAYGGPEHLPFDMGHLRHPIGYNASPEAAEQQRLEERKRLTATFEKALKETIETLPPAPPLIPPEILTKAGEWRTSAVEGIEREAPVPMLSGPRLALHLIPATAFGGQRYANLSVMRQHFNNLVPSGFREWRREFDIADRPGAEVWLVNDPGSTRHRFGRDASKLEQGSFWYAQVFRSGIIQIVTVINPIGEPEDAGPREFRGEDIELDIVKTLDGAALTYAAVGMGGPALAMVSLLDVSGYRLIRSHAGGTHGFDQSIIMLPSVPLESVEPRLGRALHPLLDSLWHEAGWGSGSPSYHDGEWRGYSLPGLN
jgi:hypothetical protein